MIDRTKLKVAAATVTVAAVGAGAGLAATHGRASDAGASANPSAARPAPPGRGPAGGFHTDLAAAASYLGVTKAKLQTEMRNGNTLAQIATATGGKSTGGLIQAIVAAETKQVRSSQQAGKLTKAQAKQPGSPGG